MLNGNIPRGLMSSKNIMIKKILFLNIIFLVLTNTAFCQNLVLNGSFENLTEREFYNRQREKFPENWHIPTRRSTPDFYKSFVEKTFKTKRANAEKVKPQDGKIFLGLHLSYGDLSEFIQAELSEELENGLTYCFNLFVRPSKNSKYLIDSFGVLFTNSQIQFHNSDRSSFDIHLSNTKNRLIGNTEEWTSLCGLYKAKGGERFITIGNFNDNSKAVYETTNFDFSKRILHLDKNSSAYYLFDNVSLRLVSDTGTCSCTAHLVEPGKVEIDDIITSEKVKTLVTSISKNIYFEVNDSSLTAESIEVLDSLILDISEINSNKLIEIVGYADSTGSSSEWNLKLSQARARSVYIYLVENGVDKNEISLEGRGSPILINERTAEDMKAADRRVDVVVKL